MQGEAVLKVIFYRRVAEAQRKHKLTIHFLRLCASAVIKKYTFLTRPHFSFQTFNYAKTGMMNA